jgi:lipopolysaccharide export system protein LptC
VDFVIDNVSAITLNAQGQPRLTMAASKMWHFPDENSTYLQNPLLTSLNPDGSKVVTTAQRGKVLNNGEEVLLYDDVKVIRSDAPNINTSTLSTNFLHVLPKLEKADTNQAVSIVMNNSNTITGIGMEMDLKTRLTKLLSNVKAVHEQIVR